MKNRNALILILAAFTLMACGGQTNSSSSESLPSSSDNTSMPDSSLGTSSESEAPSTGTSSDPASSDPGSSVVPGDAHEVKVHALSSSYVGATVKGEETSFVAGEIVTITLSAGENLTEFTHDATSDHFEQTFVHVGDDIIKPTWASGEESCTHTDVTFLMPNEEVDVYVAYCPRQNLKETGYGCTLSSDSSELVKLFGIKPGEKYDCIDAYVYGGPGFVASSFECKIGNDAFRAMEKHTSPTRNGVYYESRGDGLYRVTVMPDYEDITGEVTIKVEGKVSSAHSIIYSGLEETSINYTDSVLPDSAVAGDSAYVHVYCNDGYFVKNISLRGLASGTYQYISGGIAYFTMPDNDVYVDVTVGANLTINYVQSEHIESVKFTSDFYGNEPITTIAAGESFYVFATPSTGYEVTKAILNDTEEFADPTIYDGIWIDVPDDATEVNIKIVAEAVTTESSSSSAAA